MSTMYTNMTLCSTVELT